MPVKNGSDSKKSLLQNQFGMPLNIFWLLFLNTEPYKRKERRNKIIGRQIMWIKNRINAPFV